MSSIHFTGNTFFPTVSGVSFSKNQSTALLKENNTGDFLTLSLVNTPVSTLLQNFTEINLTRNWKEFALQRPQPLKVPSYDAVNAALGGIYDNNGYSVSKRQIADGFTVVLQGYDMLKRSGKLEVQALAEQSEQSLNQKISNILDKTGITPDGNGKLDFSLDQNGVVKITGGIEDSEQKQKLENIFNADEELKQELMVYQARKSVFADKCTFTPQTNAVIFDVYERMNGRNPADAEDVRQSEYTLNFSFQDGRIFQNEAPNDSVFNNRLDSLAGLAEIIGISPDAAGSVQSFAEALENNITDEENFLTDKINAVLAKSGLAGLTKKITFSADENGNIVVDGNIRKDKLKQLQQNINADTELRELLKTHRAKQDILAELQQAFQDEPDLSGVKSTDEWESVIKKFNTRPAGFDLAKDELSFARSQLLGEETSETVKLASFKRGKLSGTEESANIDEAAETLRKRVAGAIKKYNDSVAAHDDNLRIADWTLTLDENGRTVADIKTKGNNTDDNQRAERFINSLLSDDKESAGAIFEAHDDEHGDVKEYKHQFILTQDGYSIESPEADKAALAEMQTIGGKIFSGLQQYFNSMFGSSQPFGFILNDGGKLSLDAESGKLLFAEEVNKVLKLLNDTDNPDRILPSALNPVAENLLDYQEAASKLHTKYSK